MVDAVSQHLWYPTVQEEEQKTSHAINCVESVCHSVSFTVLGYTQYKH